MNGIAETIPTRGRAKARPPRLVMALAALLLCAGPGLADDVVVSVVHRDEVYEVRGRFTSGASLDTVWRVLTDYDHISSFVESMRQSAVEHREGPRVRVRQVASVGVFPVKKTARVTLEVLEQEPTRIAFNDTCGEDFRLYTGSWELLSDSTQTTVVYALDAMPKAAIPHWLGRSMMSHAANDLLKQVRAEIERRAGAR